MAAVSSLLPASVGHGLSRPSAVSPRHLSSSSASGGNRSRSALSGQAAEAAATTALVLRPISILPARIHENRLYSPLNSALQSPRSSAAAIAATAAADAATAAAAAARAAAVAAAAAGAASAVGISSGEEVELLERGGCRIDPQKFPTDSSSAKAIVDLDQCEKSVAAVNRSSMSQHKADLSLACRPVQRRCGGRVPLCLPGMSVQKEAEERRAAVALEESETARGSGICKEMHMKSTAGIAFQNGAQSGTLSRTLSCFSSFSFKPHKTAVDYCSSNSHNHHAQQPYEKEHMAGQPGRVVRSPSNSEKEDVQQTAVKLHQLASHYHHGEPHTERHTACGTSRRGSGVPLPSTTVGANAGCSPSTEQLVSQLNKYGTKEISSHSNTNTSLSSSEHGQYSSSPRESNTSSDLNSYRSRMDGSSVSESKKPDSDPNTTFRSPRDGRNTDREREGNICVLGSARQVTPESSRISSRMSCGCGDDDGGLIANVDYLPFSAKVAAGATTTREKEEARHTTVVTSTAGVSEGVRDVGANENVGDDFFQRRRGGRIKDYNTATTCNQHRQQQQQEIYNPQPHMMSRCLSMPGELFSRTADNRLRKAEIVPGSNRPLTAQDVLQVQRQHQQKSEVVHDVPVKNVLTSKYLLSTMKLDLLKLRRAEKECPPGSSGSSALSTSRQTSPLTRDHFTPQDSFSRRTSHFDSSSVKSFQSSSSASSSRMLLNTSEAAASVVALARSRSSPRSQDSSWTNAPCISSSDLSSSFALSPASLTSFAASLAVKAKHLLSTVLPSLLLLVEPPSGDCTASLHLQEASQVTGDKMVRNGYYSDARETETTATQERQSFSEWGHHGLSPLDAIQDTEENKATRSSKGDTTPTHVPPILIQGEDEVDMLRGTSFRRDTIVRHSLSRAKDLWEKIINCCW